MKRREFLINSSLGTMGIGILGLKSDGVKEKNWIAGRSPKKLARNIIFLVSDGMSIGTLQMADLFCERKLGRHSHWIQLYLDRKIQRGLMDTASADSYVTDSAAASSAWGGGVRVKNGRLNVGSNNVHYTPILQKFQAANKGVGCVTTVPITHATPAGFCVTSKSRNDQAEIAEKYLALRFNVMLGGGSEYFHGAKRTDDRNLFEEFQQAGYQVVRTKGELAETRQDDKPLLGVFSKSGLPFSIDQAADSNLQRSIPTLAEMTMFAIDRMKHLPNGFVLQIEGGKVDWAAHANDAPALIYDQLAFDDAVKVAMDFAEADRETLVIITTDHGNANPGLMGCSGSLENFARAMNFTQSHSWIMQGFKRGITKEKISSRIEQALGFTLEDAEINRLHQQLMGLDDAELTDEYKLPYAMLASIVEKYTSVGWAGDDHSGDFVELALFGPGSELVPPFVKNSDLHNYMLKVTDTVEELVVQ